MVVMDSITIVLAIPLMMGHSGSHRCPNGCSHPKVTILACLFVAGDGEAAVYLVILFIVQHKLEENKKYFELNTLV